MLARLFQQVSRQHAEAVAIDDGQAWTYAELSCAAARLQERLAPLAGRRVGVALDVLPLRLATLVALDALGATALLLPRGAQPIPPGTESQELAAVVDDAFAAALDVDHLRAPMAEPPVALDRSGEGSVVLFTSGTSGPPKPARHSWHALAAAVRQGERYRGRRWLLSYDAGSFAGIQLWLQALLTGGTLCAAPNAEPHALASYLESADVHFASGTPTFWRMLLGSSTGEALSGCALQQITLGGEPVGQGVLDALRAAFPDARLSHIYASTEMGVCFSVHDGRAGFPAALLEEGALPHCRLRIASDGELQIQSSRAMQGYADASAPPSGWFATGDLVERRGDRVYFIGRKNCSINVGGTKVYPEEVEDVIRQVPGVCDVRVSAMQSSLVGQLVRAEVQALAQAELPALREAILAACRRELPKHKVPASVEFPAALSATESGKLKR